jgi:hypothetical protein
MLKYDDEKMMTYIKGILDMLNIKWYRIVDTIDGNEKEVGHIKYRGVLVIVLPKYRYLFKRDKLYRMINNLCLPKGAALDIISEG